MLPEFYWTAACPKSAATKCCVSKLYGSIEIRDEFLASDGIFLILFSEDMTEHLLFRSDSASICWHDDGHNHENGQQITRGYPSEYEQQDVSKVARVSDMTVDAA